MDVSDTQRAWNFAVQLFDDGFEQRQGQISIDLGYQESRMELPSEISSRPPGQVDCQPVRHMTGIEMGNLVRQFYMRVNAICDRLIHNGHVIQLRGASMRKRIVSVTFCSFRSHAFPTIGVNSAQSISAQEHWLLTAVRTTSYHCPA
jgi:hypothetical protein